MISGKKKGLGRGLSALFGDEKPAEKAREINNTSKVLIGNLSRNPYQPRQSFSDEKLEELAQSIKKNGIIQPIAVRPSKSDKSKYEIVAGERRWLAAQRAGLHEIPVTILNSSFHSHGLIVFLNSSLNFFFHNSGLTLFNFS